MKFKNISNKKQLVRIFKNNQYIWKRIKPNQIEDFDEKPSKAFELVTVKSTIGKKKVETKKYKGKKK